MRKKGEARTFYMHEGSNGRNSLAHLRAHGSEQWLHLWPAQRIRSQVKMLLTAVDQASSIKDKAQPYLGVERNALLVKTWCL